MKRLLNLSRKIASSCRLRLSATKRLKSDKVPPLLMYTTASPHVFVCSAAIDESPERIHPKSLFTEETAPPSFQSSAFRYISPAEFNFELPGQDVDYPVPEIAFLGRSNVGKSSLLNSLTTKDLAKTSKTPGRTQQVNYFGLYPNQYDAALGYIIDLPGYGYAKAPDEQVEQWQKTTQEFLQSRIAQGNLTRIYILIDARRGMNVFDSSVLGWLDEADCDYTVVVTKADAVGKAKIVKVANEICMRCHAQRLGDHNGNQGPFVHVTSSKKKIGILDLMWAVDADFSMGSENLKLLNKSKRSVGQSQHYTNSSWGKEW